MKENFQKLNFLNFFRKVKKKKYLHKTTKLRFKKYRKFPKKIFIFIEICSIRNLFPGFYFKIFFLSQNYKISIFLIKNLKVKSQIFIYFFLIFFYNIFYISLLIFSQIFINFFFFYKTTKFLLK